MNRINVLLGAIAVLLLLLLLIPPVDRSWLGRGRAHDFNPLLPDMAADPDSFSIRNDSVDFTAVPREGRWWQVAPVPDWADGEKIVEWLRLLREARVLRVVEEVPGTLERYGLASSRAIVRVDRLTLLLGDRNPVRDGVYGKREGSDAVLLVGKQFARFATVRVNDLRDRSALRLPVREVETISLERPGETVTLRRRGELWYAEEPSLRASATAAWRIVATLHEMRIHAFRDDLPFVAGDDPWRIEVGWRGKSETLQIGACFPGTALRHGRSSERTDPFVIPGRALDSLSRHAAAILDRKLFFTNPFDAERIGITSPLDTFEIEARPAGGWRIVVGESASGNRPAIRAFLRNLADLGAVGFLPRGDRPVPFRPDWTVRIDSEVVEIDGSDKDLPFARRHGEEGLLLLGPGLWHALQARPNDLSER